MRWGAPARRGYLMAPLFAGCALLLLFPIAAAAIEFEIRPQISANEEFNDNLFETMSNKKSDFITTLQPGASLRLHSPTLQTEGAYSFQYRNYARGSRSDEFNNVVTVTGQAVPVQDFFFIDFSENLTRVSLDVTRDRTTESSFLNQSDVNNAVISPYFVWRLGENGALRTGYRYLDTRYWSQDGVNKQEQIGFAEFTKEVGPRTTLLGGYSYSHAKTDQGGYGRQDLSAGFKYQYDNRSFLFGTVGNSWLSFDNGNDFSNRFWNAGITHDFGTVVATLETRVQYTEDPLTLVTEQTSYSGRIEKEFNRGALGAFVTRSKFVVPESSGLDRHQTALGVNGRYEFSQKLLGTVLITGDKTSLQFPTDYPYHFNARGTLAYTCNYDVSLALSYTYVTYRYWINDATGATEINRALFEIRKVF